MSAMRICGQKANCGKGRGCPCGDQVKDETKGDGK